MKLKKINALLSLLAVPALLLHIGYTVFAYLTFYYNPDLKLWTAVPFMVLVCLHAICGMATVFLQGDGTRLDLYPRQNRRTVLQRVTAALIFPLLILHINTFDLLKTTSANQSWLFFVLLMLTQPLFYAVVLTHVAVSVTRAMITLGWISDRETQNRIDRVVWVLCALVFLAATFAVVKGQLAMFLPGGGAV